MHTSLWAATGPATDYPPLDESIEADALVVGAGITGLVTALLLQREGLGVTVIDQHRVGAGVTGYTTGKLSSLHQLVYSELSDTFGVEGARTYAEANEAGLARLADLVEELAIDCDFRRRANYTYAASADDLPKIEAEVDAAAAAGLDASFVSDVPLPFPTAGAIRVPHQAEFHPVRFTAALAAALVGRGRADLRADPRAQGGRRRAVHRQRPAAARSAPATSSSPRTSRFPTAASTSRACTRSAPTAWRRRSRASRPRGCSSARPPPHGRSASIRRRAASW